MTEYEYRTHPAISRSELWRIRETPAKFKYYRENPEKPTEDMILGQVFHKIVLQPESFEDEFAVAPCVDRRTKSGKEEWSEFEKFAEGKTVVTADAFKKALEMKESLLSEDYCVQLLSGEKETPFFWTDELTGEDCKCRTDCIVEIKGRPFVVDLKSTGAGSTNGFQKSAVTDPNKLASKNSFGYDFQAAMYLDGVKAVTGKEHGFIFIAVEKKPPYLVNIFECEKPVLTNGYDIFRYFIGEYHYCKTTGNWYGYMGRDRIINTLSLPSYLAKAVE